MNELSGVWGKKLFELDEKRRSDEQGERVFLTPIVLVLLIAKVRKIVSDYMKAFPLQKNCIIYSKNVEEKNEKLRLNLRRSILILEIEIQKIMLSKLLLVSKKENEMMLTSSSRNS